MQFQTYDAERKIDQVGDMKVKLDLIDLFRTNSRSESYQSLFWFLRQSHLFWEDFMFFFK